MGMPLRSIDDGNQGGLSDLPVNPEPSLAGRKPKSWHAVIGTLSIIIGVLGLVCWGCGSVNTLTMPTGNPAGYDATQTTSSNGTYAEIKITKAVDESDDAASETKLDQPNLAGRQGPMDIVLHFVSFLLSIMLLVGGIGMINRKPWSRSTLMLWAWLKILITIIWLIWQFASINDQIPLIAEEMRKSMEQQGNEDQFEMVVGWVKPVVTTGIILVGLFFLAWPLFLVFFLGRDKIRTESNGWGGITAQDDGTWSAE